MSKIKKISTDVQTEPEQKRIGVVKLEIKLDYAY